MFEFIKVIKDNFLQGLNGEGEAVKILSGKATEEIIITDDEKNILYAKAGAEVHNDERDAGIWARAIVGSEGDSAKVEGLYIKYRFTSLKNELITQKEKDLEEIERRRQEEIRMQEAIEAAHQKEERKKEHRKEIILNLVKVIVLIVIGLFFYVLMK